MLIIVCTGWKISYFYYYFIFLFRKETDGDWVTMGVLYYKAPHKSSSSGNEFSVWKLTDLRHSAQTD
jgi:hypothetical protein